MNNSIFFAELRHEFRTGLKSPLLWIIAVGVVAYLATVLLNAEYAQQMGATDIPRNSPHIVYLMTAGQGFWMFFSWAWMFSRLIARDRDAKLQEIALASPVSLKGLLLARFGGVFGLAIILGLASPLGFLIVHPMEWAGLLKASDVGPIPMKSMLISWLIFTVPSALGMGSLFTAAAIRTRNSSGPFAVAGGIMLFWMLSMIIIRGGEMDPALASVLDPLAFAEVEYQADNWTPADKMQGALAMSVPLIVNRLIWGVLPVVVLIWSLLRVSREALIRGYGSKHGDSAQSHLASVKQGKRSQEAPKVDVPTAWYRWLPAVVAETRWQLSLFFRNKKSIATLGLMFVMGVAGSFVHVVSHGEGPLDPRPELITGLIAEFFYLMLVVIIAGFVGATIRRDFQKGFDELVATTCAPFGVRVFGVGLTSIGIAAAFSLTAGVSGLVVSLIFSPSGISLWTTVAYFMTCYLPALLEVCGVTIFVHALIKRSGVAYGLSMFCVFVFVLNPELGLINYPPAMLAMPFEMSFSELASWRPWVPEITAFALLKLGELLLLLGVSWLLIRREPDIDVRGRMAVAVRRLRGGAGVTIAVALALILTTLFILHNELVVKGGWQSPDQERENNAKWEREHLASALPFSLQGGSVRLRVEPEHVRVLGSWTIEGLRVEGSSLHAELPSGLEIKQVKVQDAQVDFVVDADHLVVPTGESCRASCRVQIELVASYAGWSVDGRVPWIAPRQAWIRATDVLPRLGIDPERMLVAPLERLNYQLPKSLPEPAAQSSVAAKGVAPAGRWDLEISAPAAWKVVARSLPETSLDFAFAWLANDTPEHTQLDGVELFHGSTHRATAKSIVQDIVELRACISELSGWKLGELKTVLQAPRDSESEVHGRMLWLAENDGWDVKGEGLGRLLRRRKIAKLIASAYIAEAANLRRSAGSRWLDDGVAGWVSLECARRTEGLEQWEALMEHGASEMSKAMGALKAPVRSLVQDAAADWVGIYSPLAISSWAMGIEQGQGVTKINEILGYVKQGKEVPEAVQMVLGTQLADQFLGKPRASDLSIEKHGADLKVRGQRWIWGEQGWEPNGTIDHFVQISKEGKVSRGESSSRVDAEPFTALDASPSFERSVSDNVWD